MSVRFREPKVELDGERLAVRVRVRVENASREVWKASEGFAVGYQIFDPDSGTIVVDGKHTPLGSDVGPGESREVDLRIELPAENSRYRVVVSPLRENVCWYYQRGWRFLLVDAAVNRRQATLVRTKICSAASLRRETLGRSVGRAFTYPVHSIWANRSLIRSMVKRDISGRYRGSFAGLFWTVLNPLLLMTTYFFVFGVVLRTRFGNDPSRAGFALYFLAGMLPWLAFSEAAGRAPFVILEYRNFVKKLVFPLETLPVNLVAAGIVTEFFAIAVFLVGILATRGAVPLSLLWLPALAVPQVLFTLGICWFLAALGVYFRDIGQIIGFLLTLWFFLTPICYPVQSLPPQALPILGKNPMFTLVAGYRAVFLESRAPEWHSLWKLWLVAGACFVLGHAWFHKLRKNFADVI